MRSVRLPLLLVLLQAAAAHASAQPSPAALCHGAIAAAELDQRIPDAFLSAIAKVESGRPVDGMVVPWPWTINAEGVGSFFATKSDAIAAVQALQARGVRSIDVGCMQVNLQQHPEAFRSLDQAFDPVTNARFAANLLISLFGQVGSWPLAAAAYHSQTPTIGAAYQRQVLAAWAQPDRPSAKAQARKMEASKPAMAAPMPPPPMQAPPVRMAVSAGGSAFGHQVAAAAGEVPHATVVRGNGRGLAAYREMPVRMALRLPSNPG